MTIIPTGGDRRQDTVGSLPETHRDRYCNGFRARRWPSLVSGPLPLEKHQSPPSLAVMDHCDEQGEGRTNA